MSVTEASILEIGLCLYEDIQSDYDLHASSYCLPERRVHAGVFQALQSADFRKDSISDAPSEGQWLPLSLSRLLYPLLKRWSKMNGVHQAFLFYLGLSLPCLVTGALEVYWEKVWAVVILLRVERNPSWVVAREQLDGPRQRQPFSSHWNSVYSTLEQLLEQQGWGSVSVHKRWACLMLNWHSFYWFHLGYLSCFSPGKTVLATLTSIQPYFRHLHLLLSGKFNHICKVDIVVMALTKIFLYPCWKKLSESFLFMFWSGFLFLAWENVMSLIGVSEVEAQQGRTRHWLEECCSQQTNTDRVHSSVLCPSLVCYWLMPLREEVLLTQTC